MEAWTLTRCISAAGAPMAMVPTHQLTAATAIGGATTLLLLAAAAWIYSLRSQLQKSSKLSQRSDSKVLSRQQTDLIINRKWKEVLEWVVFDPQQLSLPDKKGHTILHHLCLFCAPIEIIQMVLWQCPELASRANADGEIPLHWAVRLSAPNECIRSLLQANRQSATTFHDKEGHSALSLFWDRYNDRYMQVWWEGKEKLLSYRAWQRLVLFFQPGKEDLAPSPLHVAAQSACPPALFPLLIQVYKDKLHVLDARGRNPLQIACSDSVSNRSTDLRTKIHYLLKEDATASHHLDHSGRKAIEIALHSGIAWNEGLQELFDLDPIDILRADALTCLPPFLLAAVGATQRLDKVHAQNRQDMLLSCSEKSLTTIFQLLKTNPSCLEMTLAQSKGGGWVARNYKTS